jgi:hypothetical protein
MATQQAGMGGIIQGGYDSDVEGGNGLNDTAGFETFSDKAVSYYTKINYQINFKIIILSHQPNGKFNLLFSFRYAEASFGRCMAY